MNVNGAKYVVLRWMPEQSMYEMGLYVVDSTHHNYPKDSRVEEQDFQSAVFNSTLNEGYVITILPALV